MVVRSRRPGVTTVKSAWRPVSGSVAICRSSSPGRGGRTGSAACTRSDRVSVTISGDGQTIGQYVVDTATRSRCPAANAQAVSLSWTRIVSRPPGAIGSRSSCDRRWARFSTPYETRGEAPSGATSHRRTATNACGRSTASTSSTTGAPRISRRLGQRFAGEGHRSPSSSRWSPGNSGPRPPVPKGTTRRRPCRSAAATPTSATRRRPRRRARRRGPRRSGVRVQAEPARAGSAATATRVSATHRPGRSE